MTGASGHAALLALAMIGCLALPKRLRAVPAALCAEPLLSPAARPWGEAGLAGSDQRFIAMMIPHHQGAIAMAAIALARSPREQIRTLAASIQASQGREIEQMRQWHRRWFGTEVPSWRAGGHFGGMGMGWGPEMGMGRRGMDRLKILRTAPDVDRAFLEEMIPHHRMGVMMASHAQWGSTHPELRALEAQMGEVQSEEI
ncbi:MAG: DUF305 domain-containing protein, partial [Cyanobium sp.]